MQPTRYLIAGVCFIVLMVGGIGLGAWLNAGLDRIDAMVLPDVDGEAVTFVIAGNTGADGAPARQVRESVQAFCDTQGCDAAILLGDVLLPAGAKDLDDPRLIEAVGAWQGVAERLWVVPGDRDHGPTHDRDRLRTLLAWSSQRGLETHAPTWTAAAPAAGVRLVALDSTELLAEQPDGAALQRAWVDATLRESVSPLVIALVHDPAGADAAQLCGRVSLVVHAAPRRGLHKRCDTLWLAAGTGSGDGQSGATIPAPSWFTETEPGAMVVTILAGDTTISALRADGSIQRLAIRRRDGDLVLPDGTLLSAG